MIYKMHGGSIKMKKTSEYRSFLDVPALPALLVAAMFLVLSASPSLAAEQRQHEAHEHGAANLNIAVEGDELFMEFSSPAINLVGFEHPPRTNDQKKAVKDAIKMLEEGSKLFVLPAGSKGRLVEAEVETDIEKGAGHEDESGHGHAEEEEYGDEHGEGEGHHDDEDHHSEFEAHYRFKLGKPGKLDRIDVNLFKIFPSIDHIEVQIVTESKQTSMELTASQTRVLF
jgi:hypothetical protein